MRMLSRALLLVSAASGAVAACTGRIEEAPTPSLAVRPAAAALKRLTPAQYTNAVHDVLGASVVVPSALDPVQPVEDFLSVGSSQATVSERGARQYETAAYTIAKQVLAPGALRDAVMPCSPAATNGADYACASSFVRSVGRRLWRRTLTETARDACPAPAIDGGADAATAVDDEVGKYACIASAIADASDVNDFYAGLEYALAGLLQSPSFLFRVELGQGDASGARPYTSVELATRLSFFLWNSTPDDELLDAAEHGDLTDDGKLSAQVRRMLDSDRARVGVRNLFQELFVLPRVAFKEPKDTNVYTAASGDLPAMGTEQTLLTLEDLVLDRDADYRELFTSRRTFVNRKLAALYGIPAPSLDGYGATMLPDGPRAGFFGHVSFLAQYSHAASSSATQRGKFIRRVLLCGVAPDPPPVVPELPPPSGDLRTLRQRLTQHRTVAACASCHSQTDPVGLGLENFDGLGQYRTTENDATIDASGVLDGIAFADARGLGRAVARHPDLASCLARRVYLYGKGTPVAAGEEDEVTQLGADFARHGFRVKSLLTEVTLSVGFRQAKPQTGTP